MIVTNLFSAVKRFPAATMPEFLFPPLFRAAYGRVPRVHVQFATSGSNRRAGVASHTESDHSKQHPKFYKRKKKLFIYYIHLAYKLSQLQYNNVQDKPQKF